MTKKTKMEADRKAIILDYCYDRLLFAIMDVYGVSLNQCKAIAADFCLKKRGTEKGGTNEQ